MSVATYKYTMSFVVVEHVWVLRQSDRHAVKPVIDQSREWGERLGCDPPEPQKTPQTPNN
eukprot:5981613-Amphidinium_carterae.1